MGTVVTSSNVAKHPNLPNSENDSIAIVSGSCGVFAGSAMRQHTSHRVRTDQEIDVRRSYLRIPARALDFGDVYLRGADASNGTVVQVACPTACEEKHGIIDVDIPLDFHAVSFEDDALETRAVVRKSKGCRNPNRIWNRCADQFPAVTLSQEYKPFCDLGVCRRRH
jgi:hypothetical protein